jgi:hypothetical protein
VKRKLAFEEGLPKALWGDFLIAAGIVVIAFELYKLATIGIGSNASAQIQDGIFFVVALILLSAGASMKSGGK